MRTTTCFNPTTLNPITTCLLLSLIDTAASIHPSIHPSNPSNQPPGFISTNTFFLAFAFASPRLASPRLVLPAKPLSCVVDPSIEPETQPLGPSKGLDDKGGSTSHPSRAVALSGSDVTPPTPTASSRCTKGVVGIFSAEGSWDPAFVVAPGRLVALQNKAAARRRGARRARQVAWHRIDGPEASDVTFSGGSGMWGGGGTSLISPLRPARFEVEDAQDGEGGCTLCLRRTKFAACRRLGLAND